MGSEGIIRESSSRDGVLYFPHGPILSEQYGLEVTAFHIGNDDACGETRNFIGDMLVMGVY